MISNSLAPTKLVKNEEHSESPFLPSPSKKNPSGPLTNSSKDETKPFPTDLESYSRILLRELEKKDQTIHELQYRLNESIIEPSQNMVSPVPPVFTSSFEEMAQSKLIQLTKKNRSLQLQLSKSHTQNQQLRDQLTQATNALQQMSLHPPSTAPTTEPSVPLSPSPITKAQQECRRLKEQLQHVTHQLDEERSSQAILKLSMQKWQRLLEKETGEPISKLTATAEGGGGWKGRAQQITILKAKVASLESKFLQKKDVSIQPCVQESIRLAQEKRRAQFTATMEENKQLKETIADYARKLEGLQARTRFLSQQESNLKQKLQLVIQKATKDDHLIQLLQKELNYWKTSAIPPPTSQPSPSLKSQPVECRKPSSSSNKPSFTIDSPTPVSTPSTLGLSERDRYESEAQQLRTKLRIYQNEIQVLKQTLESVQTSKEEEWMKFIMKGDQKQEKQELRFAV